MKTITLIAPAIIGGAILILRKGKDMATKKSTTKKAVKKTTSKKVAKKTTKKATASKKQLDALKKGREALKKKQATAKKAVRKELAKTKKAVKKATSKIMTSARKKATKVASKKMDNLSKNLKKKGLAGTRKNAKTKEVKVIQFKYENNPWEDVSGYDREEYGQIRHDLKEYRMSGGGSYRVITRRVKND